MPMTVPTRVRAISRATIVKTIAAILLSAMTGVMGRADTSIPATAAAIAAAPEPSAADLTTNRLLAEGRRLFLASCAHCHGADARGDDGPDLHALEISDRRITTVITRGIKGEMPSFAKKHGADDIAALIVYLRSLE